MRQIRSVPSHDSPTLSESEGVRYLHFGTEWIQGAMRIKRPSELVLDYTVQMMAWLLFMDPPKRQAIGLLGLGAASLARFCARHTTSDLHAVEWNPQVTAACRAYFRLPSEKRLTVTHIDAADWVGDPANRGMAPVLMVDLYDAQARGPVRDSIAFYRHCRRALGSSGVMTVNLFGEHESYPRNIDHISQAFEGRVAVLPEIDAGNRVALAFSGAVAPVSPAQLLARADMVQTRYGLPARRWARSLMGTAATTAPAATLT